MKVIAVKTIYLTDEKNQPIPEGVPSDQLPVVYHGPFKTFDDAAHWMHDVYPDGDEDVFDQFAAEFEVEESWLNDPANFDQDIRRD